MEEQAGKPVARRKRHDKEATRAQILEVARDMFSNRGYHEVSLRQITSAAGFDAAMVIRYFGSKDGLFAEAMQRPEALFVQLQNVPRENFGEHYTRLVLSLDEASREYNMLVALLHSASDAKAARQLGGVATCTTEILTKWLEGDDAALRAGLIFAQITGLFITHRVFKDKALTQAEKEAIVARVAPAIQMLVENQLPVASRTL